MNDSQRTFLALLGISLLLLVWMFYRKSRSPNSKINIDDLFLGEDQTLSRAAVANMTALFVTTWIMVQLTVTGKLTEGYFLAYGGMWVAQAALKILKPVVPPATTPKGE